ncbi:GNAT family N-acetyltransferase [Papillibacter cinnamivorans]|uniref:Acetyltransferase (GNAT) domain-containing protein n=1 Tax=Papillibacter cinnamivorans DSM 12816 TaxID=1122930 RepID=A0A1W2A4T9_9FIRM|nr:GNAT family N-acetyltransferase [Papillibacter cinnamivorans]SMC55739.1 Acetyltransferase (GNAT) domain-containing protein [Papillibacter cinnamivorans DSM 12816]
MTEIRLARFGDVTAQKQIWRERFHDPWSYIHSYYKERYRRDETLLLLEDGVLAAMLTLMPMGLVSAGGKTAPTLYLYAIASADRVKGRGLGTVLLEEAGSRAARLGVDNIILVPAERSLHDYFGSHGYEEKFSHRELRFERPPVRRPVGRLAPAGAEEYDALRERLLAGSLHVRCGSDGALFQKGLSRRSGADLYRLDLDGFTGCAAAERGPGKLVTVKELLLPDALLEKGLNLIARELPAAGYRVRVPAGCGKESDGRDIEFGMIWRYFPEDKKWETFSGSGYLGFGFD